MSDSQNPPRVFPRAWPLVAIPLAYIGISYFGLNNIDVILIFTMAITALLVWAKLSRKGIFAIDEDKPDEED